MAATAKNSLNFNIDSNKNEIKRHTIFLEIGGSALFYSINYDLILKQWKSFSINSGIGFGIIPAIIKVNDKQYSYIDLWLPIHLSVIYGKRNNKIELGLFALSSAEEIPVKKVPPGVFPFTGDPGYSIPYYIGVDVGFRYQKKGGGLFLKSSFNVFFSRRIWLSRHNFFPWIGLGLGYTFK